MKDILTAPFIKEMGDVTANIYRQGWAERNGGNISFLLDEAEVSPYKLKDRTPCAYCDFREVCGFDEKLGFSYRSIEDKGDIMEKLKAKAAGGEQ